MKKFISVFLTIVMLSAYIGVLPVSAAANHVMFLDMSSMALPSDCLFSKPATSSFSSDTLYGKENDTYACITQAEAFIDHRPANNVYQFSEGSTILFSADFAMSSTDSLPTVQVAAYRSNSWNTFNVYYSGSDANYTKKITPGAWHNISVAVTVSKFALNSELTTEVWVDGEFSHKSTSTLLQPLNGYYGLARLTNPKVAGNSMYVDNFHVSVYPAGEAPEIGNTISSDVYEIDNENKTITIDNGELTVGEFKKSIKNVVVVDSNSSIAADSYFLSDSIVYAMTKDSNGYMYYQRYELIMPENTKKGFFWDVSDNAFPYTTQITSNPSPSFVTGIYDKGADDTVVKHDASGLFQITEIDFANEISEGDRIELSFDAAFSEFSQEYSYFVNLMTSNTSNAFRSNGVKRNRGLNFADGTIEFFGEKTTERLETEKWYSFRLVYDIMPGAYATRITLYIGDREIISDVFYTDTPSSSIQFVRFSNECSKAAYYDNIALYLSKDKWERGEISEPVSSDFQDSEMSPLFNTDNSSFEQVSGIFGRDEKDTSLKVKEGYVDFVPSHEIIPGDTLHYSFDFAVDSLGNGAPDYLFPILFSDEKAGAIDRENGICVQNGRLIFYGLDKGIEIEAKKWYRVTMKISVAEKSNEITMSVNVNGISFEINQLYYAEAINAIGALRFESVNGNGLYIDDVYFGVYDTDTEPQKLKTLSIQTIAEDGKKLVDNQFRKIYLTGNNDITVGEFLSHINSDNVVITLADGSAADDNDYLAECRVYAVQNNIYYTKFDIINKREYYCKYEDFENGSCLKPGINAAYSEAYVAEGIGDGSHGKSLVLKGKNVNVANAYTSTLEYNFTHGDAGVFTLECMINITGGLAKYSIQLRNSTSKLSYMPVSFLSDGSITSVDSSVNITQKWEEGVWLPVTLVSYPRAGLYELYVNGKYMGCGTGGNIYDLNQIRFVQELPAGSEISDIFAVDNLRVYSGTPELYYTEFYNDGVMTADRKTADSAMVRVTEQQDAVAVLAEYDATYEKLVKVSEGKKAELDKIADAKNVTLYIWDNLTESMMPLIEPKTIKGDEDITLAVSAKTAGAISSNMVFQRNEPIVIWGTAEGRDGTYVKVSFAGNTAYGEVNNGCWEVALPEMEASAEPKTLTVTARSSSVSFDNILIGDVYMVAGQSNAHVPMVNTSDYETYLQKASENDNIRVMYQRAGKGTTGYYAASCYSDTKSADPYPTKYWKTADSTTLETISAIGYYNAVSLREAGVDVPIGIIMAAHPGEELAQLIPTEVSVSNGITGSKSYNSLISPFEKLKIAGLLWYQGETDSMTETYIDRYEKLFSDYVAYIRNIRNQPDIKVFAVQLSSHDPVSLSSWNVPAMRATQYDYSKNIDGLYLIPSLDKGPKANDPDFAHPEYKLDIGKRIAAVAEAVIYGKKNIEDAASPVPSNIVYDENGATITFKNTVDGLTVSTGDAPVGFELTKDGIAYAATASIVDDKTIRIEGVQNPDGVRYAFYMAVAPALANVVNSNGLPCPTFVDAKADSGATSVSIRKIPALSVGQLES